jgi:hypothetical protein
VLKKRTPVAVPSGCASTLVSFGRVSGALGLDSSVPARRLSPVAVPLLRSELLVLDTRVSLVVTCTLPVLLSSTARLVGLGLPEAVRLCDVDALEGCGEGLSCRLESDLSLLKLSRALADIRVGLSGFSCAGPPFTPNPESLAEDEDIVRSCLSASVAAPCKFCRKRCEYMCGRFCGRRASSKYTSVYMDRVFDRGERASPAPSLSGARCISSPSLTLSIYGLVQETVRHKAQAGSTHLPNYKGASPANQELKLEAASTVCLPGAELFIQPSNTSSTSHLESKQNHTTSTTTLADSVSDLGLPSP